MASYGKHTAIDSRFFANYHFVALDDAPATIGAIVCAGVTIGDNTGIGAASVVTRDIPSGVAAAGDPCRSPRPSRRRTLAETCRFDADGKQKKDPHGCAEREGASVFFIGKGAKMN